VFVFREMIEHLIGDRRAIKRAVEVLESEAQRNTQVDRWAEQTNFRDAMMEGYTPGRRGEAKRIWRKAAEHEPTTSLRTVRGWIEDYKKPPRVAPKIEPTWAAVVEGETVSRRKRDAANARWKPKI
jgi:hypothetical protein